MGKRRYDVRYVSPGGEVWNLVGDEWVAGLRAGGLEGLTASANAVTVESPGVPGQRLAGLRFGAATGSLKVFVRGDGRHPAGEVWARFRACFPFRPPFGVLTVGSPFGEVSARVRYPGGASGVERDPEGAEFVPLEMPLVNDDGVWWLALQRATGNITVTNFGDVYVWPLIRWNGAGGAVTLPSGATFTLPAVQSERGISLDPLKSRQVLDQDGAVDDALWRQLRGVVLSEGIPPGGTRTFVVPDGAVLEYQIGVVDPWR